MDAHSSNAERLEQTVNEGSSLFEILDTTVEYNYFFELTAGIDKDDSNEISETLKEELSKSNWRLSRYIINRQIASIYDIPEQFHSSLYAVQRLGLLHKLRGQISSITSLSFNEKGNFLASGSNDDGTITIWDWEKGKKLQSLQCIYPEERELAFYELKWLPLDAECFIISSDSNGELCMIDIHTGDIQKLYRDRNHRHSIATFKDLSNIILSADDDSNVFSIDVRENKATKLLSAVDIGDCCIQFFSIDSNPLNSYEFCVAGNMSCINVYDRRKPTYCLYQMYPEHMGLNGFSFVDRVLYNHNGTEVIAAYGDEAIYLFDTPSSYKTSNFTHKYEGTTNSVNTIKGVNFFGPNSEFIVSSSDNGHIFIWDKKTEAVVRLIRGYETFGSLEPHPHIPVLASSGTDVCIWTPSSEE